MNKRTMGALETIRKKHASRMDDDWITINGTHVQVEEGTGVITSGPQSLRDHSSKTRTGGGTFANCKTLGEVSERLASKYDISAYCNRDV